MKFKPHKEIKRIWRLFKLQRELDWEDQMFDKCELNLHSAISSDSNSARYYVGKLGVISRRMVSTEKAIRKIQAL